MNYRNMKIKELPDTPVNDAHVAIANRGYRSLYTGLDLFGWQATSVGKEHWHVQDWVLSYDGKTTPVEAVLTSDKSITNAGFIFDIQPGNTFENITVCGLVLKENLKSGEWHRIEVTVQGKKLNVAVDGQSVAKDLSLPVDSASRFTLQPVGAAEFANIYTRDLAD